MHTWFLGQLVGKNKKKKPLDSKEHILKKYDPKDAHSALLSLAKSTCKFRDSVTKALSQKSPLPGLSLQGPLIEEFTHKKKHEKVLDYVVQNSVETAFKILLRLQNKCFYVFI